MKLHYTPVFGDAYMADTRHLSLQEHGAYFLLMLIAWRSPNCALPIDDRRLATMLGVSPSKWAKMRPHVMSFWTQTEHGWEQKRLSNEWKKAQKNSEKKSQAADARWNRKPLNNKGTGNAGAYAEDRPVHMPPIPNIDIEEKKAPNGAQEKKPAVAIAAALPDWLPVEAWQGWLDMRKKLRKPPTDRAMKMALDKLDRWRQAGHDIEEILNRSTMNSWVDLYEPRGGHNGSGPDRNGNHRSSADAIFAARRNLGFDRPRPDGEGLGQQPGIF